MEPVTHRGWRPGLTVERRPSTTTIREILAMRRQAEEAEMQRVQEEIAALLAAGDPDVAELAEEGWHSGDLWAAG